MTVLRNGTYFGECLVDCNEEIVVTPGKATYSLTSNFPDAGHPDIRADAPVPASEWEALAASIDWNALRSLPAAIGSPDAADAGGEFLEVSEAAATIRVDLDLGATVPEIAALLEPLRRLRARLASRHGR